jgi:branched-chain amino acid transport system substrate-binding protein
MIQSIPRRILLTGAAACALLLGGGAEAGEKLLKIGVLGPMSGQAAQWGVELHRGAEIRAQEINAAGGLQIGTDVYKIELIPYDHKSNAAEALTVTNRLIFQDKVKYIVGNAIGATTSAAQTLTEPNQVLFTFISWGIKNLGPDKPFSFRTDLSGYEVVEPFYRWIKEKYPNIKKVAVLAPNDESGKDSNGAIVASAKQLNFEIVADEYYPRETKDFYSILTRVLAKQPDFIDASNSPGGAAGLIVKQLNELNYKGAKGWTGGINADVLIKVAGAEAAQGTWSPWSLSFGGPNSSPELNKFLQSYQEKYKETPGSSAVANYIALDVITKAMQKANSIEPAAVVKKMTEEKFDTLRGPLAIGGSETYGADRQFLTPVTISEIRGGQVVDIAEAMPRALLKLKQN